MKFALLVTLLSVLFFSSVYSNGLNGVDLKLAAIHGPPFDVLTRGPSGNYTLTGTSVQIFEMLAGKLSFTYTVVPVVEETLISKLGTNEAAFYKVINKEVDGILAGFIMTLDRKEKMDFTHTVWVEEYTLLVPKPKEENRLFAFIRPFQLTVWIYFLATLTVMVLLMGSFSHFYFTHKTTIKSSLSKRSHGIENSEKNGTNSLKKFTNSTSYFTVYNVGVVINQGGYRYLPYSQNSFRVLAGGWLLAAVVLVNSYSSIVVSSLTLPKMKPAVNSLEDLAASKDVSIILRKDFALGQQILSATSGVFKALGDQARQQPADRIHTQAVALIQKLETGRYAYPYLRTFIRFFVGSQLKKDRKCRFQSSNRPLPLTSGNFSIVLQKNSKYTSALSLGALHLWES